jgi:hypothetical protein
VLGDEPVLRGLQDLILEPSETRIAQRLALDRFQTSVETQAQMLDGAYMAPDVIEQAREFAACRRDLERLEQLGQGVEDGLCLRTQTKVNRMINQLTLGLATDPEPKALLAQA